ncbi:efflux RND transporter periplasmic adaptor subunit [Microbulbifer discodermiae]|uniref:efflux RND transporter periplasmic adaptor subunit n=1 Tax=Microbulbifer sp. 2201CG32-9 TaxID=3232309 RepID=UPI00345B8468
MKTSLLSAVTALFGLAAGWWIAGSRDSGAPADSGEREVAYWVAPMDSSFRRDAPGKSPMGMALVPVYEDEQGAMAEAPGTVRIPPQVQQNLGVRTDTATREHLSPRLQTVGLVGLDEQYMQQQHSRLSGWVQRTWVKAVGDRVRAGQPLLGLYSPELVTAQRELVAAVESGNRILLEATRERLRNLGIPREQIERVEASGEVSDTLTLYAEASGYVDTLGIREGMYITPATALISVGPLSTVWVEGQVFPREGQQVQEGAGVEVTADIDPARRWQGRILQVLPGLDEQTRTLTVRVAVDNPDQLLRPGMFVGLQLDGPEVEALTVPRAALIRTGTMDRVVMALGGGNFRSVRVRAGREFGDRIEILQGLQSGDRVVTSAQFLIDSESSVSADLERIAQPSDSLQPWVTAQVLSMPDDNHYARLQHGAVLEWNWTPMTMGFFVAQTARPVLRQALETGGNVMVQLRRRDDGKYEVISARSGDGAGSPAPSADDPMMGTSISGDPGTMQEHRDGNHMGGQQ